MQFLVCLACWAPRRCSAQPCCRSRWWRRRRSSTARVSSRSSGAGIATAATGQLAELVSDAAGAPAHGGVRATVDGAGGGGATVRAELCPAHVRERGAAERAAGAVQVVPQQYFVQTPPRFVQVQPNFWAVTDPSLYWGANDAWQAQQYAAWLSTQGLSFQPYAFNGPQGYGTYLAFQGGYQNGWGY